MAERDQDILGQIDSLCGKLFFQPSIRYRRMKNNLEDWPVHLQTLLQNYPFLAGQQLTVLSMFRWPTQAEGLPRYNLHLSFEVGTNTRNISVLKYNDRTVILESGLDPDQSSPIKKLVMADPERESTRLSILKEGLSFLAAASSLDPVK